MRSKEYVKVLKRKMKVERAQKKGKRKECKKAKKD